MPTAIAPFIGDSTTNTFRLGWLPQAVGAAYDRCIAHFTNGLAYFSLGRSRYIEFFTGVDGVPPIIPDVPHRPDVPRPLVPPNGTTAQRTAARAAVEAWDYDDKRSTIFREAMTEFKQDLMASLTEVDKANIALTMHPQLGYVMIQPIDIFTYMFTKYGTPTLAEIRANQVATQTVWDKSTVSLEAHVSSLRTAIRMSTHMYGNVISEFNQVELLRNSLINAPTFLKKVIDKYDQDNPNLAQQFFQGPTNNGLAPLLIAEAARVSGDQAGARGFANLAAHEFDDNAANAATRDGAASSAGDKAELARLKADLARVTADRDKTKAENAKLRGATKKTCSECKDVFVSHNPKHTTCKSCFDKNATATRAEADAKKK
jgi:hypothetical protein